MHMSMHFGVGDWQGGKIRGGPGRSKQEFVASRPGSGLGAPLKCLQSIPPK
jgi:hypothetical protein